MCQFQKLPRARPKRRIGNDLEGKDSIRLHTGDGVFPNILGVIWGIGISPGDYTLVLISLSGRGSVALRPLWKSSRRARITRGQHVRKDEALPLDNLANHHADGVTEHRPLRHQGVKLAILATGIHPCWQ